MARGYMSGGGGSSLPPITPSDNNKVLGVINGNWSILDIDNTYYKKPSTGIPETDLTTSAQGKLNGLVVDGATYQVTVSSVDSGTAGYITLVI